MVSVKIIVEYLFAGVLLVGFAGVALAEVKVSVDRNPVPVNESFELVLEVDYRPDRDPDFSMLRQHFTIIDNNRVNTIGLVDGEYRRSTEWTLQLVPKQVGEFVIPAIRVGPERSKPVRIAVKPPILSSLPQDELVLQLEADVDEVYVQSQVLLTLRLLSEADISAYEFGDIKIDSSDVVIEPLGDEHHYQTRIADRRFHVRERRYTLFPQQSGRLEVGPVMAEAVARYDPFGTGGSRRIRSRPLSLEVKPIPAGNLAADWLPATRLELREEWRGDTSAMNAGEPVTRILTLLADGLTAAQLPELELPAIDGIRQYPEQPSLENDHGDDGIRGKRVQQVALVPGGAGIYRVPELRVPWWNLETGRMEVATLPARELVVAPSAAEVETKAENPAVAPAPAAAAGNRFWLWLSLLLACGWAANVFYCWMHPRRVPPRVSARTENEAFKAARRQLYDSCAADDAAAARYALLDWGRALLAPREISNLHQLGKVFGDTLVGEIEALNRSLYAKDRGAWHGGNLADLCRRLERERPEPRIEQPGFMLRNSAGQDCA